MVHAGEIDNEEIFGTYENPGPMRTKLLAFVPEKLFRDDVEIQFRIADQNGLPVTTKADASRDALRQLFGNEEKK